MEQKHRKTFQLHQATMTSSSDKQKLSSYHSTLTCLALTKFTFLMSSEGKVSSNVTQNDKNTRRLITR